MLSCLLVSTALCDSPLPGCRQNLRLASHQQNMAKVIGCCVCVWVCVCSVTQLCPTLGNPMDCSLPGSSVRGISQARVLDWVTISPFQGIFLTQGSNLCLLGLPYWQVDSLPLHHLGSPLGYYYSLLMDRETDDTIRLSKMKRGSALLGDYGSWLL